MELTRKQQEGLNIAVARYRNHELYTVIGGYAGTGKSTLVRFIISALHLDPERDVAYITYTGKAAEVLRKKGNPNAMTAHKLLYYCKQKPNGKYSYRPRTSIQYRVVVCDEISMLPKDIWNLLLSHHKYVIACGDPYQLPPVNKDQDNHVLDHPHIFLDEIMRQAQESDIIRLSMDIREGKLLVPYKGVDAQVFRKQELVDGMYRWADQILTATNRTRFDVNEFMRRAEGRGMEPEDGDKVICLRNCWDLCSDAEQAPLINGSIGWLDNIKRETWYYRDWENNEYYVPILNASINTGSDVVREVPIDYQALTTGTPFFTPRQEFLLRKIKENPMLPIEFNYGHAITTHKAQGSEWDKVLVMEEWFPNERTEHSRWLYTAVTRASDKLTLVLKN